MSQTGPFVGALVVGSLALAPAAEGATFEGRTEQGGQAQVVVRAGEVKKILIRWRARCDRPRHRYVSQSASRPPFDFSSRAEVRDADGYSFTDDDGNRARVTARLRARRVTKNRWRGTFTVKVVTRRDGQVVDRCRARGLSWSASRVLRMALSARPGEMGAGEARITQRAGKPVVTIRARGLEPTRRGQAYEVWLYNDENDAVSLGAQLTDRRGRFAGTGRLPANYRDYRYIDVSRERVDDNRSHSGDSVLRGRMNRLR